MAVVFFLCIGLFATWYTVAAAVKQISIIESVLFSIIGYFFSHVFFSGLLFWVDQYSIKRTVFLCMLSWVFCATVAILKQKKPEINWNIKRFMLPIIVSLIVLPLVIHTFEFYGFGQDEGVYQTQAICFIHGITERQFDFDEYYQLETEEERSKFDTLVSENYLIGFYRVYDEEGEYNFTQSEEQAVSERSGVFHGIPVFSALLALWGLLFGIEHMMGINTVFFVCSIFMLAIICDKFGFKKIGKTAALLVYSFSPLVIWISKSALTEIGLTLIWLTFILLILEKKNKEIMASAVCIWIYAFYHVSVYAFMPLYVLLYLGLYLYYHNKTYIKSMLIAIAGYVCGYWMMQVVGSEYTTGNYRKIYFGLINEKNAPYIIMTICVIFILLGIFLLKSNVQFKFNWQKKKIAWGIRIFISGAFILLVYRIVKLGLNYHQFANITLIGFAICLGMVIPILVYIDILWHTEKWILNRNTGIILSLFLYCIILYSVFFMPVISYYYYYARYLVMYLPLLAAMGGIILDRCKIWKSVLAICINVLIVLPFDNCLLQQKDDTRVEWNTFNCLSNILQVGDKVVLDDELFPYYYFPLKAISGVEIYPLFDNYEDEFKHLSEGETTVYYLTVNNKKRAEEIGSMELKICNHCSEDQNVRLEDYLNPLHHKFLQLPLEFVVKEEVIYMYKYDSFK